jgi:hypothetical protein
MAGETIVFFAKYTTLVGNTVVYYSDAFDVTGYRTITAETGFGGAAGSGAISAQMEQSSDMQTWTAFGSAMAPTSTPVLETETDPARYIRLKVTISGSANAAVSFWAKAVARES